MDNTIRDVIQAEYNAMEIRFGKDVRKFVRQEPDEVIAALTSAYNKMPNKNNPTFVEIGSCWGGNLCLIGNSLHKLCGSVNAISVDLPNQKKWGGENADIANKFHERFDPYFVPRFIIGNSQEKKIIDLVRCNIDMLFIDGDHSLQGCLNDFNNYAPMVVNGGIILIHDIKQSKPAYSHIEVHKAWQRITSQTGWYYEEFCVRQEGQGIGLLVKEEGL